MDIEKILASIKAGTAQIIPEADLIKKLKAGKKLIIKLGMDPTSPDLHLGHAVVLKKLKLFQDLGHQVVFLIGDFTARIGDPSGRSKTRPPLTEQEIQAHMQTYFEQVSRILDPKKATIAYNSQWLSKLTLVDVIDLCKRVTLSRIIEREDFATRLSTHQPIGFHELLYPLMQGYDSVVLKADVELGGTDQTFNLLMGRFLQEEHQQEPQVIITMPLLIGLDGVHKMSKSLGNAISFSESAESAYGKLMSISDELMWLYYQLLLGKSRADIEQLKQAVASRAVHPMDLKKQMAHDIVAQFWSQPQAVQAQHQFEQLFQKRDYESADIVKISTSTPNPIWIVELLKVLGAVKTSSDAKRLIESRAIEIDGSPITDFKAMINWKPGMIIKAGKHRFYKLA